MDKQEALAELKQRGVAKVVLDFSGGNDEGGVNRTEFEGPDGEQLDFELIQAYHLYGSGDETTLVVHTGYYEDVPIPGSDRTYKRGLTRPATPEEVKESELREALAAPIYKEYGSFAGDFSVEGTLTWDVASGKVVMEKSESFMEYYGPEEVEV